MQSSVETGHIIHSNSETENTVRSSGNTAEHAAYSGFFTLFHDIMINDIVSIN